MFRHLTALCLALLIIPQDSHAQTRERIGYGRLITNDSFAVRQDRWRSGSFASSRVWGYAWDGALPNQAGEIIELRLGAEIISPSNLRKRAPGDRPYAGVLTAGLHTHFQNGGFDYAMGADLVVTGPQTRLDRLQIAFHDLIGISKPSERTLDEQVPDAIYPSAVVEAGYAIPLSDSVTLRPFAEGRVGVETLARAGADLTIGSILDGDLLVRDPVTGQRYRTIPDRARGYAFVLGADIAAVENSAYFPAAAGAVLNDTRHRVRGGLHWQMGRAHAFYGLTYLGEEFEAQDKGQLVGSIRLSIRF